MTATVNRWGNSLSLRIPRIIVQDLGIKENSVVEMSVVNGKLVVIPQVENIRAKIAERFENYKTSGEIIETDFDWGEPQGEEIW